MIRDDHKTYLIILICRINFFQHSTSDNISPINLREIQSIPGRDVSAFSAHYFVRSALNVLKLCKKWVECAEMRWNELKRADFSKFSAQKSYIILRWSALKLCRNYWLCYLVDLSAFWHWFLNFEPFNFPYITMNFFFKNALKSAENM